ncbi:MAG TPA: PadR family transcriptional regulator [Thermoanaerobaculia bacterium]|nr:PadR family transcriptional regulator [Thermoanaerobaculia bacterium]
MSEPRASKGLSNLQYHVLLALAGGPLYGYGIKGAVELESGGTLNPGAGSLYRMLARLMGEGLVRETSAPVDDEPHPGLARRYYELSAQGRRLLGAESRRLRSVAALAAKRLGAVEDDRS